MADDLELFAKMGIHVVQQNSIESKIQRAIDAQGECESMKRDLKRLEYEALRLLKEIEKNGGEGEWENADLVKQRKEKLKEQVLCTI